MKNTYYLFVFLSLFLIQCKEEDKTAALIKNIPMSVVVDRFDQEFSKAKPADLPKLKKEYPLFFPKQYPDSIWVAKMKDSLQLSIQKEVDVVFSDFSTFQNKFVDLYQHLSYYYPRLKKPKIVTLISEVDYVNRVVLADSFLIIGLDNYLGNTHKFYKSFPKYVAAELDTLYLLPNVVSAFAKRIVPKPSGRSFLDQLVYYGKELYLQDVLLPKQTEESKIGYSVQQLAWVKANEEQMWRYFIENKMLYSTDKSLVVRFLDPAPFSKFGLDLDNESPGRSARFIGWQIVKSFMDSNSVDMHQMMQMPADEIFKRSKYKPKQ